MKNLEKSKKRKAHYCGLTGKVPELVEGPMTLYFVFAFSATSLSAQSFDVVTHSDATRTGVTPLLGNAEAEFVGVALVGRDTHLEDADAFCALVVNLVVVVRVLDLLEALLLAEFNFVDNRAVQVQRKVVLEVSCGLIR